MYEGCTYGDTQYSNVRRILRRILRDMSTGNKRVSEERYDSMNEWNDMIGRMYDHMNECEWIFGCNEWIKDARMNMRINNKTKQSIE